MISLLLNNSRFGDFIDRIYPFELEKKDTRYTDRSALYLDLHLEIDSDEWFRTKLYDKRDDFNFPIVNFPFICNNIQVEPAYGVHISQLIRYSRACCSYQDFHDRGLLLTEPRVLIGKVDVIISKALRSPPLVNHYGTSVSQTTTFQSFPHS